LATSARMTGPPLQPLLFDIEFLDALAKFSFSALA
jgi:hypothetical protein